MTVCTYIIVVLEGMQASKHGKDRNSQSSLFKQCLKPNKRYSHPTVHVFSKLIFNSPQFNNKRKSSRFPHQQRDYCRFSHIAQGLEHHQTANLGIVYDPAFQYNIASLQHIGEDWSMTLKDRNIQKRKLPLKQWLHHRGPGKDRKVLPGCQCDDVCPIFSRFGVVAIVYTLG